MFFLWPLVILKKSFVLGDYAVQFYPWSRWYAEGLRTGHIPLWTDLITGGFPLGAEGQTAPYYLLHLVTYFLLPFKVAYTWNIPFHILLGGIGFYIYAQRIGLSRQGAALAAVLFSFSSAYGGCFYTTGTLRALSWLPWSLYVLEKINDSRDKRSYVLWSSALGVLFSQMWTAGFPQIAVYAFFYLFLVICFDPKKRMSMAAPFALAGILGVLLALPQVAATLELAPLSVRAGEGVDFALWGSVFPFSAISLIFPSWSVILKVSFYIGIPPLLLVMLSLFVRKTRLIKMHVFLAVFFFLLALGKYNPVYAAFVKVLSLTFMRNPSKFLFFSAVSLSVLAGFGLDRLVEGTLWDPSQKWARRLLILFAAFIVLLPGATTLFLKDFHEPLIEQAHRYAQKVYVQKSEPVKSIDDYYQRADQTLLRFEKAADFKNNWNFFAAILGLFSCLFLIKAQSGSFWQRNAAVIVLTLTIIDLALFGSFFGGGFIGNAAKIPGDVPPPAVLVQKFQEEGTVMAEFSPQHKELIAASANLLYGIAHAGGYSPLLIKRYYQLTKELGITDASLGKHPFKEEVWLKERNLLNALGIRLLLSDAVLDWRGFKRLDSVGDRILYENSEALPRLYGVFKWRVMPDASERLNYLKSSLFDPSKEAVVEETLGGEPTTVQNLSLAEDISSHPEALATEIEMPTAGIIVFRSAYYPRWKAVLDGSLKPVFPVNHAFSGVWAGPGRHSIAFYYDRRSEREMSFFSIAIALVLVLMNIGLWYNPANNRK